MIDSAFALQHLMEFVDDGDERPVIEIDQMRPNTHPLVPFEISQSDPPSAQTENFPVCDFAGSKEAALICIKSPRVKSDNVAIDPVPPEPVFDLNYPEVRIALRLSRDIGVRVRFGHQGAIERFPAKPSLPSRSRIWLSITRHPASS